jgi:hypothetical protein
MSITGYRYVGTYEGHAIELIRNNWDKTLSLVINGDVVAWKSCMFPGRITLTGSLQHNGASHAVVAKSVPRNLLWTTDTIEIDDRALPLTSEKPRRLLKQALTLTPGAPPSRWVLALAFVVLAVVGVAVLGTVGGLLVQALRQ